MGRLLRSIYRMSLWAMGGAIAIAILGLLPFIHPAIQTTYTVTDLTTSDLAHGFYRPQTDDAGNTFAWTEAAASTTFPYVGTLPVQLHLELRSAAVAGGPDAPVRVLVSGTEVARLHPDPHRLDFQPFQLRVRPAPDHALTVTFMSEAFRPTSGDRRILGTMLRSVAVERADARASIAAWSWLYGALPLCLALIALRAFGARRPSSSRLVAATGYAAVGCGIVGILAMLLALALLAHIGPIDRYRYAFWVEGTLFIAGFLAVVTVHLPLGDAGAPSLIARLSRLPIVMRQMRPLRRLRDTLMIAAPAVVGWPLLGTWGTSDVRDKLDWMQNIASFGLVGGFRVSDNDYPPGTSVILAGATRVAHRFMLDDLYAYKLSLLVFLVLTGLVLYHWTRNSAAAAILQLALLVESVVLGYNDVYFLPFVLLALWALHARKWPWFGLLLGVSCVIKWQPLIVAPVLLLAACIAIPWDRRWLRNAMQFAGVALVPALVVLGTRALFGDAFDRALIRGTSDSFLSANALNGYWIVTVLLRWLRPAALTLTDNPFKLYISIHAPLFMLFARALFLGTYGWIVIRWWRAERTFTATLYCAYLAYLAYCMVSLSVHENHLVLAVVFAAALWARDARDAPLFLGTALSMNLNLLLFYGLDGASHAPNIAATLVLSGLNLAVFVMLLIRGPFPMRVLALPAPPAFTATAVAGPARSDL